LWTTAYTSLTSLYTSYNGMYELKQMQFPYTVNAVSTVYAGVNYLERNLYSN